MQMDPVSETRSAWHGWAEFLHRHGLEKLAAWVLEAAGPLTVLGAQALYIGWPAPASGVDRYAAGCSGGPARRPRRNPGLYRLSAGGNIPVNDFILGLVGFGIIFLSAALMGGVAALQRKSSPVFREHPRVYPPAPSRWPCS